MSQQGAVSIDAAILNLQRAILAEPSSIDRQAAGSVEWEEQWMERIKKVQELPWLLRQRRNASFPVNSLPLELYGEIVKHLQPKLQVYDQAYSAPRMKNSNSWMLATSISQRWRNATLSNKGLWRRICIGSQPKNDVEAAVIIFQRSSQPVEVVHEYSDDLTPDLRRKLCDFYSLISKTPERLEGLYLRGTFEARHPAIQLTKALYQNLTEFELYLPCWGEGDEDRAVEFSREFVTQCQQLRRLSTPMIDIPTDFPQRPLTHLYLHNAFIQSAEDGLFLSFLKGFATTLQVLHMHNSGRLLEFANAAPSPVQSTNDRLQLGSLLRFKAYNDQYQEVILPFLCLHNVELPRRATIVWEYDSFSETQLYAPQSNYLPGLLPPSDWLSQVEKVIWISHTPASFVVENGTFYDTVENMVNALPLISSSCPNLKLMAAPPYDWNLRPWEEWEEESLHVASKVRYLHTCWSNSIFALLSALEAGVEVIPVVNVPEDELFGSSRMDLTNHVSLDYEEDGYGYRYPLFPALQSLVIYIGDVDIDHTAAHDYLVSQVLERLGLASLQLNNAHEMVRKHHSGAAYNLTFSKGGQEMFEAL